MNYSIGFAVFVGLGLCITAIPVRSASQDPIVTEATVNAPIEEVWKMFTTKDAIESWMVTKTDGYRSRHRRDVAYELQQGVDPG